ncbi:hypothetical protein DV738_g4998, partial [Chaetothyriales sp. CBS 135597]
MRPIAQPAFVNFLYPHARLASTINSNSHRSSCGAGAMDNYLERLQVLHADLVAYTESRLAAIERLWQEIEDTLADFRRLLDIPSPTSAESDAYNKEGKLTINGQDFSVSNDFKQIGQALATALGIDVIEASKLLIQDHGTDVAPTIEVIAKSVGNFHDRRDLLLQCLRLTLQAADNEDEDSSVRDGFLDATKYILNIKTGPGENASAYLSKCLAAMASIHSRSMDLSNELQSQEFLGKEPAYVNMQRFQKSSLFKQHEALGSILTLFFRGSFLGSEDLGKLNNAVSKMYRMDFYLLHYLPAFSAAFKRQSIDAKRHADLLNPKLSTIPEDRRNTPSEAFHNVIRLFWTVEYAQYYQPGKEYEDETNACGKVVKAALEENALEFLLAICTSVTKDPWRHPARKEMVSLLLADSPDYPLDGEQCSSFFREMLMEAFEVFAEAWITNLPDSVRQLKNEEDEQRLLRITAVQDGTGDPQDDRLGPLHFESFLILMSYAFENRPDAAYQCWEDTDNNLYGFLQWVSARQTVPRASAFCELLSSLADDPDGAAAAHKFLLEGGSSSSRTRRIPSMNYQQILAEIALYSRKVHEKAPTAQLVNRKVLPTDMNEAESPVMLSCYLRLLSHLSRRSSEARDFILGQTVLDFPKTILLLSSGPVPSYLRASVFAMLDALATDMDWARAATLWQAVDDWASNSYEAANGSGSPSSARQTQSLLALQNALSSLASAPDQYSAFISLLRSLLLETPSIAASDQLYNFPENLGATYRSPGITPYLDFACGQVFCKRIPELSDDTQALVCSFQCLDLIATGLETFHESFIVSLVRNAANRDAAEATKTATTYAQRHPFSRLMQWVLSSDFSKALLKHLHTSPEDVDVSLLDSPLLATLQRAIDVLNLALDRQATYQDIVKPLIKDIGSDRLLFSQVSVEEAVFEHSDVILYLCQYAASDHPALVLRSLSLLQKLSSSPKLNNHFLSLTTSRGRACRVIDLLGPNASAKLRTVSSKLATKVQVNLRALEDGVESLDYVTKDGIFAFVNACLATQPEIANIAHVLLGFTRLGEILVRDESAESSVLFDALIEFVQNYPHGEDSGYASWLVHLKTAGMQTLRHLWVSSVSRTIATSELRRYRLLPILFATQENISDTAIWDGRTLLDPGFWFSTSADALVELLDFRSILYEYGAHDIRACASERSIVSLKQNLSTVNGKSIDVAGAALNHPSIFNLADFLEISLSFDLTLPESRYFAAFDPESFRATAQEDNGPALYSIEECREALTYFRSQHHSAYPGASASQVDVEQLDYEYDAILAHLIAKNRLLLARQAWRGALRNYADLVIAVIELCPMEPAAKTQFLLQMLQLVLPKLDALVVEESADTVELARAADALMFALSISSTDDKSQQRVDNMIIDKTFQLFRTSVDGILMSNSDPVLRATLYSICSQYLSRITAKSSASNTRAISNTMDTIRSAGQRFINILSDDAEDGSEASRHNALQLLSLLTSLSRTEKSNYIIDSLVKANVLELLLDPLKRIAADLQDTSPGLRPSLLTTFQFRNMLLLQVSRTRHGANALLDAGLLPALKSSLLFRADPDIGLSPPPPPPVPTTTSTSTSTTHHPTILTSTDPAVATALHNYFSILSTLLRLLLSTLTSRGTDNTQSIAIARAFLSEYRPNLVGIYKKYIGLSSINSGAGAGAGGGSAFKHIFRQSPPDFVFRFNNTKAKCKPNTVLYSIIPPFQTPHK